MAKRRRNKYKNKPQPSSQPSVARQQSTVEVTPQQNNEARGSLQTIEQERAKHALDAVKKWGTQGASDQKELKSYVVGMPAMILMSGFGQTCAFYKSNKKDNHAEVLKVLEEWLKHGDLMDFITNSSAEQYQLAQVESLAYLNWLKKFAKAYLEGEGDDAAAA